MWAEAGKPDVVEDYTRPLYAQAALDEAVRQALDAACAQERERCAAIARQWGETHADGVTVNARNAASKIARGIEGPNVKWANRALCLQLPHAESTPTDPPLVCPTDGAP